MQKRGIIITTFLPEGTSTFTYLAKAPNRESPMAAFNRVWQRASTSYQWPLEGEDMDNEMADKGKGADPGGDTEMGGMA